MTIGHGAGTGSAGAAEDQLEIADRNLCEGRQILLIQFETQLLRIEGNRTTNVFDLIPDAPQSQDEALGFFFG